MEIFSLRDYFSAYIRLMEMEVSDDNKLEPKELEFLVDLCVYNSGGSDLGDFGRLCDYFSGLGRFTRRTDVSTYKKKLTYKKWIRAGRNRLVLPKALDILRSVDGGFLIWHGDGRRRVDALEFRVRYIQQGAR